MRFYQEPGEQCRAEHGSDPARGDSTFTLREIATSANYDIKLITVLFFLETLIS